MSTQARRRLSGEYKALQRSPSQAFIAKPNDDSLMEWTITIRGPQRTPYRGGIFYIDIKFPDEYPRLPPRIQFLTKVFHPQVAETGETYLALTDERKWRSIYTIADIASELLSMLMAPTTDGILKNLDAGFMLDADESKFAEEAARCTALYACKPY